jgi:putative SOS response-associated peptidase YedK
VLAVHLGPAGRLGAARLRWRLIPSWAVDSAVAQKLVNARGKTAFANPSR